MFFTRIVIKRAKAEIQKNKDEVESKIKHLVDLDKDKDEKWETVVDKGLVRERKLADAKAAVAKLLEISQAMLEQEDVDDESGEEPEPGTLKYHLVLIAEFLSNVIANEGIQLPGKTPGSRPADGGLRTIYQEEFNDWPQELKDAFIKAETLIAKANQIAKVERLSLIHI